MLSRQADRQQPIVAFFLNIIQQNNFYTGQNFDTTKVTGRIRFGNSPRCEVTVRAFLQFG